MSRLAVKATIDQLDRVVFVSSFSRTVSASLRVGFLACKYEIDGRLVRGLLTDGHCRKHLESLRSRQRKARGESVQKLERNGREI